MTTNKMHPRLKVEMFKWIGKGYMVQEQSFDSVQLVRYKKAGCLEVIFWILMGLLTFGLILLLIPFLGKKNTSIFLYAKQPNNPDSPIGMVRSKF